MFYPRLSEEPVSLVIRARSWKKSMQTDVSSFSNHFVLSTQDTTRLTVRVSLLQLVQSNFVLFCTYAADLRDHFQNIVLTILVSGTFFFNQKFPKVPSIIFSVTSISISNICIHICQSYILIHSACITLLTRLPAHVYPGFCRDKHPVMAVVSAKVWEEDSSFLWHHSKYTFCAARALFGFPKW